MSKSAIRNQKSKIPPIPDLSQHLRDLLEQIPSGRVVTYGQLAESLGNIVAARWVAMQLLDTEFTVDLPVHRVVQRDGRLGGYFTGNATDKAHLLRGEGIDVGDDLTVELAECAHRAIVSAHPLAELRQLQEEMIAHLNLRAPQRLPDFVGGVDVSYITPQDAVVAYSLVEVDSGELVWSKTLRRRVTFPYIPTYLSFRELPLLLDVLEHAERQDRLADVVLVDGAGILHQRHAGIATHLGIAAGLSTIGITKKKLCGTVDLEGLAVNEPRPVIHEDQTVAMALRTQPRGKPIFISPGQNVDVTFSLQVARMLLRGHKLPEPVYWAHTLSKRAAAEMKSAASVHS